MKTAMQELWEYIISDQKNIDQKTYVALRNKIHPLLQKEREQIESAFNEGYRDGEGDGQAGLVNQLDVSKYSNASQYYSTTFKK